MILAKAASLLASTWTVSMTARAPRGRRSAWNPTSPSRQRLAQRRYARNLARCDSGVSTGLCSLSSATEGLILFADESVLEDRGQQRGRRLCALQRPASVGLALVMRAARRTRTRASSRSASRGRRSRWGRSRKWSLRRCGARTRPSPTSPHGRASSGWRRCSRSGSDRKPSPSPRPSRQNCARWRRKCRLSNSPYECYSLASCFLSQLR